MRLKLHAPLLPRSSGADCEACVMRIALPTTCQWWSAAVRLNITGLDISTLLALLVRQNAKCLRLGSGTDDTSKLQYSPTLRVCCEYVRPNLINISLT